MGMAAGRDGVPTICWARRSSSRKGSVRISMEEPPLVGLAHSLYPIHREVASGFAGLWAPAPGSGAAVELGQSRDVGPLPSQPPDPGPARRSVFRRVAVP